MEYITIQSTGNAIDFGDMNVGRRSGGDGLSNSVRGLIGGGFPNTATIDYIQIATTGNAQDFGDLTVARGNGFGGCGSATRGLFGGGGIGSPGSATFYNVIDFITISTLGNASDFGDLFSGRYGVDSLAGRTRGLFTGEPSSPLGGRGVSQSRSSSPCYC